MQYNPQWFQITYPKVNAAKKIWQFYKYQKLVNQSLFLLIQELMPKVKSVLQIKENHSELGIDYKKFFKICSTALQNKANLLSPIILLNIRNIGSHFEYFIDILQILHFSTGDSNDNFIKNAFENIQNKLQQKKILKITQMAFHVLQYPMKEDSKYLIIICLDSILKVLIEVSKQSQYIYDNFRQFQCYSRVIPHKSNYKGIQQFIELIGSFNFQMKKTLTEQQIQHTFENLMQQLDCPICQQQFTQPISMQCGHNFCKQCISSDQIQSRKCPICRAEQTDNLKFSEENHFLTKIIEKLKNFNSQAMEIENEKQINQLEQEIIQNYQSILVLRSKKQIQTTLEQFIEIDRSKFQNLNNLQLQQLLQRYQKFILIDTIMEKKNNPYTYIINNKTIRLSGNSFKVLTDNIEKITIIDYQLEEIILNQNDEQQQYIISCQVANAQTTQDEILELKNPEIQQHIISLTQQIRNEINKLLENQNQDYTFQAISSFLQKSGLLVLLNSELEYQYEQLKQFTFLLPKILRISEIDKNKILFSNNIIVRLELLSNAMQRFQYTNSLLSVFKIQQAAESKESKMKEIFVIICFMFILYVFYV